MLPYLAMLLVAYGGYRLGKTLWVRSVGAGWLIVPALVSYLLAFWLLLAAVAGTRGIALLLAVAVWGGLVLGRRLGRRRPSDAE